VTLNDVPLHAGRILWDETPVLALCSLSPLRW
jgi:hypothetical protein